MALTRSQTRHLRGLTHAIEPVVTVADKGLSDNVRAEIETALDHHELVKIKLRGERDQRSEWIEAIAADHRAELVHSVGQVASFFRRNPEKPKIALPH